MLTHVAESPQGHHRSVIKDAILPTLQNYCTVEGRESGSNPVRWDLSFSGPHARGFNHVSFGDHRVPAGFSIVLPVNIMSARGPVSSTCRILFPDPAFSGDSDTMQPSPAEQNRHRSRVQEDDGVRRGSSAHIPLGSCLPVTLPAVTSWCCTSFIGINNIAKLSRPKSERPSTTGFGESTST